MIEARPGGLRAVFRAVDDATRRDAAIADLQTFHVPLGRPMVELA